MIGYKRNYSLADFTPYINNVHTSIFRTFNQVHKSLYKSSAVRFTNIFQWEDLEPAVTVGIFHRIF